MAQLTSALADSAIMAWAEKEKSAYWQPVTVIQAGSSGVAPDPGWMPLIETSPHPEYPSGHAADCFTGVGVLADVFGPGMTPITYVAQGGMPQAEMAAIPRGVAGHMPREHASSIGGRPVSHTARRPTQPAAQRR